MLTVALKFNHTREYGFFYKYSMAKPLKAPNQKLDYCKSEEKISKTRA